MLLVTGGPGVVREALKTPKKAITAGPGNPPAVVDQTADLEPGRPRHRPRRFVRQQRHLHRREDDDRRRHASPIGLIQSMTANGGYRLKEHELKRLERVIFKEMGPPNKPGMINPEWIGKDASKILAEIGVHVDPTRSTARRRGAARAQSGVDRADDAGDAGRACQGRRRWPSTWRCDPSTGSATRHRFIPRTSPRSPRMARAMNCSIFVANGPNFAGLGDGGEGFTSFSIASPTGEGLTRPGTSRRVRRVTVVGALRIV